MHVHEEEGIVEGYRSLIDIPFEYNVIKIYIYIYIYIYVDVRVYVNVGCVYVLVREYMFMGLCMCYGIIVERGGGRRGSVM